MKSKKNVATFYREFSRGGPYPKALLEMHFQAQVKPSPALENETRDAFSGAGDGVTHSENIFLGGG